MKLIITEEQFKQLISEDWYHGTEDSRDIDKIGGFGENKTSSIRYINDIDLYREFQSLLNKYHGVNQKMYFQVLDNPKYKSVWKDVNYKKPIFLSNKHNVANTYAKDKVSYDYQNSTPKTFKVDVQPGKTLTINAHGEKFRGIPIETFKNSLVNSGIPEENINKVLDKFIISTRDGRIKTDDIGFISNQMFGFDIVDVVGVFDSYNGGNTASTVRMVFDPSKIKIINENKEQLTEGKYINIPLIDDEISLELWDSGDRLELQTIVIPKNLRGKGLGNKTVQDVIKYADSVNKPLFLTPSTGLGGTSFNRLAKFYKQLGFKKNTDQSVSQYMVKYPKGNVNESIENKMFLGYHSSKRNLKDGFYKGDTLDINTYSDVIRNAYMEIISDYDENLESDDIEAMNNAFEQEGYGFTYVSDKPIEASNFQSDKYKYGSNLYKVYGNGNEILLDDYNEINATIVASKNPLYFESINDNVNESGRQASQFINTTNELGWMAEEDENYSAHKTAIIALIYKGKLLILQRGTTAPWMPNKWSLVGGMIEKGENAKAAVIRECQEEIGLTPSDVKFIMKKDTDVGEIYYFIGKINTDNVILDFENKNYTFIDSTQIDKFDFVPHIREYMMDILFSKINENIEVLKEDTLNNFYAHNNIDPDNLSYLGKGDFGVAYSIGDGRVLKTTSSKSEFEIAKQLENNTAPVLNAFAKIYKTDIVDGQMLIILEELYEDGDIESLYYELQDYLDQEGLPLQYLDSLDTSELDLSDEMVKFMDEIDDINRAYRYLGIEASDIQPGNMGYDKTGRLKAFDIEDKLKNR